MIEVTQTMRPRPLWQRTVMRRCGRVPGPPTEAEKHDAIRVLAEGGYQDDLYIEAERLLAEWGERGGQDIRAHA